MHSKKFFNGNNKTRKLNVDGNKNRVGTYSEIIVSSNLLKKGYNVYRNLSNHGTPDLVAIKNNAVVRVEVTTGIINLTENGKESSRYYDHHVKTMNLFDILAVVYDDQICYYHKDGAEATI